MDNYKNHLAPEDAARTAFEYSFPTNDGDDTESNKSTPYFTPLEYFQSSFEFPSPNPDRSAQTKVTLSSDIESSPTPPNSACNLGFETPRATETHSIEPTSNKKPSTPKTFAAVNPKQMSATSPAVHRKLRRFSLYERRSCSPQHLLLRNSSSSMDSNVLAATTDIVNDKENTKPKMAERSRDESLQFTTQSGNNSPITLIEDTNSPNIMTVNESRLTYSPKLLASINNLNLGGSPLGVISSAGYKNGNYFKFPEVDHVVQENATQGEESAAHRDNHLQSRQNQNVCIYLANPLTAVPSTHHKARLKSNQQNEENTERTPANSTTKLILSSRQDKKNRKNKNNLTIKISDTNSSAPFARKSPSPKPKTPTIKSTKEKALSLDSAAGATDVCLTVYNRDQTCVSCDEIDSQDLQLNTNQLKHSGTTVSHELLRPEIAAPTDANRSTSLSQLPSLCTESSSLYTSSTTLYKRTVNITKTTRRKMSTTGNTEWLQYHRKQNPFNKRTEISVLKGGVSGKKLTTEHDSCDKSSADESTVCGEKFFPKHIQSSSSNPQTTLTPSLRGLHKHNPLLHASNTNLKTLPEFLTLVEFTNTSLTQHKDTEYPYKQKSFDLPSSSAASQPPYAPNLRTKAISSNSATNLLQRRGSNHSLTLNLHGSCSNLLGSCRSGLSVSNYSLGSAANSTTNLNSKSSYNLDLSAVSNAQTLSIANTSQAMPQGVKQSLFRRRGSNNSLTLQLSANSCGNLNSFCSQNSLNIEGHQASTGVTRTTSFVTPTKNTASNSGSQKRGLLERRGSNQSLTLNMGSSFGGTGGGGGMDRTSFAAGSTDEIDPTKRLHDCSQRPAARCQQKNLLPIACTQAHQRKFFSSENLTKANTQFSDLNHAHKRNSQQVCFGSVSDLKPSGSGIEDVTTATLNIKTSLSREQLDFQESTVCSCTGVRNITTRPLSPQTTSEEFKIYLANIQMLQNASNALNQFDLIKLNYIFDNSYALASSKSMSILSTIANKGSDSPPGLLTTSEDCEVAERYQQAVHATLETIKLEDEEQKRMFRDLHKEFWDLPLNHQEKPMVFGSQAKNRYKTILPNENSRVMLENEWKCVMRELKATPLADQLYPKALLEDSASTTQYVVSKEAPYINANYIKGPDFNSKCYVATQGPLPNTIFEFWLMVYQNTKRHLESTQQSNRSATASTTTQQYHQKIVMLTNFIENQRQKCSVYFPIELNELFIAAEGLETQACVKEIEHFFQEYLATSHDEDKTRIVEDTTTSSDHHPKFTQIEIPTDLHKHLPRDSNYFIIKNIGIVKKNGFSIRKFSILYCVNMPPTTSSAKEQAKQHLLLRKFYCYHYWYPDWPDHRSPKDINTLLDICLHILNLGKCEQEFESFQDPSPQKCTDTLQVDQYQQDIFNDAQPLPVIHCSAGIGRTGCLVAILNGVRQLRQSLAFSLISMAASVSKHESSPVDFRLPTPYMQDFEEHVVISPTDTDSGFTRNTLLYVSYILHKQSNPKEADEQSGDDVAANKTFGQCWLPALNELPKMPDVYVDVLGIVCNLRLQRGGMVQNSEQYELIHRAICLYLKRTFALKRF